MGTSKQDAPPWGEWKVLQESSDYKVKQITVHPGQRFSYQRHEKRSEHWVVVKGVGMATVDGVEKVLRVGDTIDIPMGSPHRFANQSDEPVVFVEVQLGTYLGEDDIVRIEDDYGRTP